MENMIATSHPQILKLILLTKMRIMTFSWRIRTRTWVLSLILHLRIID